MIKNSLFPNSLESSIWAFAHNYASIMANASWIQALNQETTMMKVVRESLESSPLNLQPFYQSMETVKLFSQYSQASELANAIYRTNRYILFHQEQIARLTRNFNQNPIAQSWNNTENILSFFSRNEEINQFFPQAMELTKEIDADFLPEMQIIAIPPKQAESIRSLLPPLNLSERAFQIFLVALGCILQLLCDMALSSDADRLEKQQTQIAIQREILEAQRTQIDLQKQILEELKKPNSARSSNISTSPTGNR